jgi:catechol 2,3-dioxygenase-like lactoylglutathione lyase family enzyme
MPELDAIGLVVADMAASLAFYRRLGLEIPAEAEQEDHVEASLKGGIRLMFDKQELIRGLDPEWTPASGGPLVGFAFRLESPALVDALYADLTGLGYAGHRPPWDAFWGQRYATLRDPDGNGVDLYAPL